MLGSSHKASSTLDIQIVSSSLQSAKVLNSSNFHLLPCNIDHDGPAKVSSYFVVNEAKNETDLLNGESTTQHTDKQYEASFRGRHLRGRNVPIPPGYQGHILQETSVNDHHIYSNEEDQDNHDPKRTFKSVYKFNEIMLWGHDEFPQLWKDNVLKGLDWCSMSLEVCITPCC
ncbi:ribonuclease H2 non-catalytic subunit-domain-containing protein [Paraphysoderma sedebokerense]|nr:ribonuclease H2 non-catalytic subunit-domain-containing protein [Paraphysoderma sedebokerense]